MRVHPPRSASCVSSSHLAPAAVRNFGPRSGVQGELLRARRPWGSVNLGPVDREAGGGQLLNSQTRAVTVFFLAFAAFAVANVIVWRDRPSNVVWGLLAGALSVFSAVRTSRSAISWDSNGVVSRDTGRTRRFAWSEIADFDHDEFRGLGALLASGRRARLMSFPRNRTNNPEAAVATLREALAQHNSST